MGDDFYNCLDDKIRDEVYDKIDKLYKDYPLNDATPINGIH